MMFHETQYITKAVTTGITTATAYEALAPIRNLQLVSVHSRKFGALC